MNEQHIVLLKKSFKDGQAIQWKDSDGVHHDVKGFCICPEWNRAEDPFMNEQFVLNYGFSTSSTVDFYDAEPDDFYIIKREPFFA